MSNINAGIVKAIEYAFHSSNFMNLKILQESSQWKIILVLSIWMLWILVPGIIELPLLDRDEPRFSRATVEMMERSNPVIPYFNGEYRFDKPPLTYWWMALNYTIFGQNEFGARLHSIISSVLVGIIIFIWGEKVFGRSVGIGAAFGWSICLQNLMQGRLALADMPMILMLVVTHWAIWEKIKQPDKKNFDKYFWIIYSSMGIGFLAKGPIAIIFPVITLVFYFVLFRKKFNFVNLQVLPGSLVTLFIIAAWGIPALLMTDGGYWDKGMGTHVIDRGLKSFNERIIIPGFYVPTSLISLFPLAPFIIYGCWTSIKRRDENDAFLLSWTIGPFLVFSFYATQLIHYTLPAFPALMLMGFRGDGKDKWKFFQNAYEFLFLTIGFISIIFGCYFIIGIKNAPTLPFVAGGRDLFSGYLISIGVTLISLTLIWRFGRQGKGFLSLLVASGLLAGAMTYAGHHSKEWGLSRKVGEYINQFPEDVKPIAVGFREPSLVFYGKRTWDMSKGDQWYPWMATSTGEIDAPRNRPIVLKISEIQIEDYSKGIFGSFSDVRGETIPDSPLQAALREARTSEEPMAKYVTGINFARMSLVEVALIEPTDALKQNVLEFAAKFDKTGDQSK